MGKSVLYLAMSVDGYIADEGGGVGWLAGDGSEPDAPGSFPVFWDTVGAVIMGWNTYHQIVTELAPDSWPYKGRPCYVVTHRQETDQANIFFWNGDLATLVDKLKTEREGGIWICGGAEIIRPLIEEDLIDIYRISVIPVLLGGGKVLFDPVERPLALRLTGYQQGNGIVELTYTRR